MKRILVTGGSGFIAGHFKERLEKEGIEVENYDIAKGDNVLDLYHLTEAAAGVDGIWHFAAIADLNLSRKNPIKTMEVNIKGAYNVAHAAYINQCKINYISTCCVFGNQKEHPETEKTLPNPSELYAASKLAGEYCVLAYNRTYGIKFNILRIPTTYGPGMREALGVYVFLSQALKGKDITVHGSGNQTRTLTYIDDVIDALVSTEKNDIENEILNVSTEETVSASEMAVVIKEITNSNSVITHIDQRPGQTFREQISAEKIRDLIGWKAKTSFRDGILKTYNWMKNEVVRKK